MPPEHLQTSIAKRCACVPASVRTSTTWPSLQTKTPEASQLRELRDAVLHLSSAKTVITLPSYVQSLGKGAYPADQ